MKSKNSSINSSLNRKTNFKIYELILFGVLIAVLSIFLTFLIINTNSNSTGGLNVLKDSKLSEVEEVYDLLNSSYYKDIDKTTLIDGAINGMLSSLEDPHTSYFNKAETDNFNEVMNGSYEGIGASITVDNNMNVIVFSVFKNSPASEVGLKYGDIILEVNDKSTKGMNADEVVALIKDNNIKVAKIKIQRDGNETIYNITKRVVVIESVESEIIKTNNGNIGYLLVNNFANNTFEQFKQNLEDIESKNIKGLIIDVRDNSGGYLHSVTDMANILIPKDRVIYQIADKKNTTKHYSTTSESRNYPIAVIINKASASASEILAVSLKESYGAYVVGTNSYGKGTVQITNDLSSGGMIKFTIQKWLSPEGNWINDIGVEPTHFVELNETYYDNPSKENDNQLQKAIEVINKASN